MIELIDTEKQTLTCPRCEGVFPINEVPMLDVEPRYREQLVPINRCPQCGHRFAVDPKFMKGIVINRRQTRPFERRETRYANRP